MQISYGTHELKECCLKWEVAENCFGRTYADSLVTMLAEAEAFDTAGQWHNFLGDVVTICDNNSFQVRIGSRYTAQFISVDENVAQDDHIDWGTVEYIKLTEISELQ